MHHTSFIRWFNLSGQSMDPWAVVIINTYQKTSTEFTKVGSALAK